MVALFSGKGIGLEKGADPEIRGMRMQIPKFDEIDREP